jgi:hypothetical protein
MKRFLLSAALVCAAFAPALAQGLPTTQPEYLQVIREEIKVGHTTDHAKVEAGWPAAFARAKSPDYYVALSSITGTPEAWFVIPYKSHAAMGEGMKRENDDPVLAQELARLSHADAEHISGARTIHAVAMKDLSHGPFPSTEKQRFWEIVQFRVRPGHEADFAAAARSYGAALGRVDPEASFRVYQVRAGMPGPSYLVFSSVTSFDGLSGIYRGPTPARPRHGTLGMDLGEPALDFTGEPPFRPAAAALKCDKKGSSHSDSY